MCKKTQKYLKVFPKNLRKQQLFLLFSNYRQISHTHSTWNSDHPPFPGSDDEMMDQHPSESLFLTAITKPGCITQIWTACHLVTFQEQRLRKCAFWRWFSFEIWHWCICYLSSILLPSCEGIYLLCSWRGLDYTARLLHVGVKANKTNTPPHLLLAVP